MEGDNERRASAAAAAAGIAIRSRVFRQLPPLQLDPLASNQPSRLHEYSHTGDDGSGGKTHSRLRVRPDILRFWQ